MGGTVSGHQMSVIPSSKPSLVTVLPVSKCFRFRLCRPQFVLPSHTLKLLDHVTSNYFLPLWASVSSAVLGEVRSHLNICRLILLGLLSIFVVCLAYLFRKMLLTSSCVMGGFLELAAMRSGRRKLLTRMCSCCTYSASASSILNTTWFLLRMLSAWGDRM